MGNILRSERTTASASGSTPKRRNIKFNLTSSVIAIAANRNNPPAQKSALTPCYRSSVVEKPSASGWKIFSFDYDTQDFRRTQSPKPVWWSKRAPATRCGCVDRVLGGSNRANIKSKNRNAPLHRRIVVTKTYAEEAR